MQVWAPQPHVRTRLLVPVSICSAVCGCCLLVSNSVCLPPCTPLERRRSAISASRPRPRGRTWSAPAPLLPSAALCCACSSAALCCACSSAALPSVSHACLVCAGNADTHFHRPLCHTHAAHRGEQLSFSPFSLLPLPTPPSLHRPCLFLPSMHACKRAHASRTGASPTLAASRFG